MAAASKSLNTTVDVQVRPGPEPRGAGGPMGSKAPEEGGAGGQEFLLVFLNLKIDFKKKRET